MNWSLAVCSFLASTAWASVGPGGSPTEKKQPQKQPLQYTIVGQHFTVGNKKAFVAYVEANKGINDQIPSVNDNELRVVTYNVNENAFCHTVTGRVQEADFNHDAVKQDLIKMGATVVIFQDVATSGDPRRRLFEEMLQGIDYKHRESAGITLMIASKVPLERIPLKFPEDPLDLISAVVDFNGQKVAILGTGPATGGRERQATQIVGTIGRRIKDKYPRYILAGSVGAGWGTPAIKVFEDNGLHEIFRELKFTPPTSTNWDGAVKEFIFVSEELAKDLTGAYVLQTTSSGYLPVIGDLNIPRGPPGDQPRRAQPKDLSEKVHSSPERVQPEITQPPPVPIVSLISTAPPVSGGLSTEKKQPQEQPLQYTIVGQHFTVGNKKAFVAYVEANKGINDPIPSVNDNELRVVTYNVNENVFCHTVTGRVQEADFNHDAVKQDLIKMGATVVIFQDVATSGDPRRRLFEEMLQGIGYKHRESGRMTLMIASKVPLERIPLKFPEDLSLISAMVDFNGQKVAILGTGSATGGSVSQATQIVGTIGRRIKDKYPRYILAGSVGAGWGTPAIKVFEDDGLHEIFRELKFTLPTSTNWDGAVKEFIFVSEELAKDLTGAYVLQTTSSGYLPVIGDLSIPQRA